MANLIVEAEFRIMQISAGTGVVLMSQDQANNPGLGGSSIPRPGGMSQMLFKNDAVLVPGTDGAVTLANFLSAFQQMASDMAGASGTVRLTTADLAQVNGWATGSP